MATRPRGAVNALWLADGRPEMRDVEPPRREGEVRIQILHAGVCNTDLELVRGYYPFDGILGHEFVGVVDDVDHDLHGRRVVGEINAVCGSCRTCRAGRSNHCEDRTVLGIVNRHGVFGEYAWLPEQNLHSVPDSISSDAATFVEPLAAALRIQEQLPITSDLRVVVVGDGKLGQLIARTLHLTGCALTVVGRHPSKLERLPGGITQVAAEGFDDAGFDVAVEVTGNNDGFALARQSVRPGGTIVMKSTYAGALEFDASALVVDEITLVGSRCGPFDKALELLESGAVQVEDLIDARYPLDDALNALEHAVRPGVLKVLLDV